MLDLGSAGGFMAEALATCSAIVTGIDRASAAVAAARSHAKAMGYAFSTMSTLAMRRPMPLPPLMLLCASVY